MIGEAAARVTWVHGKGVGFDREAPRTRGSPLKSAGQKRWNRMWAGSRALPWVGIRCRTHVGNTGRWAVGAPLSEPGRETRRSAQSTLAIAHVLYEGAYGLRPVSFVSVGLLGGLTCLL